MHQPTGIIAYIYIAQVLVSDACVSCKLGFKPSGSTNLKNIFAINVGIFVCFSSKYKIARLRFQSFIL